MKLKTPILFIMTVNEEFLSLLEQKRKRITNELYGSIYPKYHVKFKKLNIGHSPEIKYLAKFEIHYYPGNGIRYRHINVSRLKFALMSQRKSMSTKRKITQRLKLQTRKNYARINSV